MKIKETIIDWVFQNDGKFPNKNVWRREFTRFLEELDAKEFKEEYSFGIDPANGTDFGHAVLIKRIKGTNTFEVINRWSNRPVKQENIKL